MTIALCHRLGISQMQPLTPLSCSKLDLAHAGFTQAFVGGEGRGDALEREVRTGLIPLRSRLSGERRSPSTPPSYNPVYDTMHDITYC